MLVELADGNNSSEKCQGKQCGSSGTSKPGGSHSTVHEDSGRESSTERVDKSEKVQPSPEPGTAAESMFFSGTSDQLKFSSAVKRKINFASSPTLVEKVKTRANRQRSKVLKSPYTDIKQKRVSRTKMNGASSGIF